MHCLLQFTLILLPFTCLASPRPQPQHYSRQTESSQAPPIAGIAATVSTLDGTDVSSSFRTLLFRSPVVEAPSNLTDRQVRPTFRPINFCRREGTEFLDSQCDYGRGVRHSLQRYKVSCHVLRTGNVARSMYIREYVSFSSHFVSNSFYSRAIEEVKKAVMFITQLSLTKNISPKQGFCNEGEICVNGLPGSGNTPRVAHCFEQDDFEPIPDYNTPEGKARLEQFLRNAKASAVVSRTDRSTVMTVESLEIDAGIAGAGKVGGQVGPTSQSKCTDCVDVATGKMREGTDFLSMDVKVNVVAAAAVAGIVWLTILSG